MATRVLTLSHHVKGKEKARHRRYQAAQNRTPCRAESERQWKQTQPHNFNTSSTTSACLLLQRILLKYFTINVTLNKSAVWRKRRMSVITHQLCSPEGLKIESTGRERKFVQSLKYIIFYFKTLFAPSGHRQPLKSPQSSFFYLPRSSESFASIDSVLFPVIFQISALLRRDLGGPSCSSFSAGASRVDRLRTCSGNLSDS